MAISPMNWHKSSYSGSTNECVEVADGVVGIVGIVPVRDSKDPEGPALAFRPEAWSAFVAGIKADDFPAV